MIEIFRTNVYAGISANRIVEILYQHFPFCKINFDLDDCDKILRVEGMSFVPDKVKLIVNENGYMCEALE